MSKEAMKLALEALKQIDEAMPFPVAKLAQAALREALAEQPAQPEPVFTYDQVKAHIQAAMMSAAQRTWSGLTDEEVESVWKQVEVSDFHDCVQPFARAIEAALRSKNT